MNTKDACQTQHEIYQRLARLDEETQERISRKYYHGTRPWLKRAEPLRRRRKTADQSVRKQEEQ